MKPEILQRIADYLDWPVEAVTNDITEKQYNEWVAYFGFSDRLDAELEAEKEMLKYDNTATKILRQLKMREMEEIK